ncbi:thiamine diphosphokinase [Streptococcus sp. H49]|uniref:thiamine diphosphokinase n=1 Tax=Streptococcus huangxiaojuni TaxID=3237239 RepID=UPI0034A4CE85
MIRAALFVSGDLTCFTGDFDYLAGADRACLTMLEQGLPLDLAVGDFDSVTAEELAVIQQSAQELVSAAAEKDDTDTELALKTIFTRFPQAQVTIFGAFGGRIDHMLANLFLPSDPDLAPFMRQIKLRDAANTVCFLPSGRHQIVQDEGMAYISFLTDSDADLIIIGAKYELTPNRFFKKKIYTSNEFIGRPITVQCDSGYLLVIQSKDRS